MSDLYWTGRREYHRWPESHHADAAQYRRLSPRPRTRVSLCWSIIRDMSTLVVGGPKGAQHTKYCLSKVKRESA